ncbi:alanine racemase [Salipaludibacillus sp. HK11]|uniref:alanine racemase n=1 Tax=Salipaludibacillus sp. HK11 TaxID=3394320 RepID=UPI0039FCE666
MFEKIQTPAIIIDESKMRNNIKRMLAVKEKYGVNLRPHFKTHKSSLIAQEQLVAGADGITVASVSEAELLLQKGVTDILVAYPLVDIEKVKRLKPYLHNARVIFAIDSQAQAIRMNEAASELDVGFEVWIKINSGLNRCGVEPGKDALALAEYITSLSGLQLTGLYTHAGHSYAATSKKQKEAVTEQEVASILQSAELCEQQGIKITNRSVGSTPTFERAASYHGITEVRPGNAVFFDRMQIGLDVAEQQEVAITILTQLISIKKNRLIFDGGSKAFTTEKGAHGNEGVDGFGESIDHPELILTRLSEEHGIVDLTEQNKIIHLGDKLRFIPNHACTAVNLFDHYIVLKESGQLEKVPIDGRGKSQ